MQTTDDPDRALKNPHDAAFRAAFRILELARAFFRDYLPENVVRHLDLENLELVNRSFMLPEKEFGKAAGRRLYRSYVSDRQRTQIPFLEA